MMTKKCSAIGARGVTVDELRTLHTWIAEEITGDSATKYSDRC